MVKRCSLAGAEALLENAVEHRDAEGIKTATAMIDHALTVKPHPYIQLDKQKEMAAKLGVSASTVKRAVTDAFYSSRRGESMRPVECKPEDCARCYWLSWCDMKEEFDLLREADRVIQRGRELLKNPVKLKRDTKQTWGIAG